MDTGQTLLVLGGVTGLIAALGAALSPVAVALIQNRRPDVEPPTVFADDPPVTIDDPVTDRLIARALAEELVAERERREAAEQQRDREAQRADACERREQHHA